MDSKQSRKPEKLSVPKTVKIYMKRIIFFTIFIVVFNAARISNFGQQNQAISAPELEKNREWLNTDRPISLAELRGKIVLLD